MNYSVIIVRKISYVMKKSIITIILLLAISPCFAQDFPNTTLGKLAKQLIETINSLDQQKQLTFFHQYETKGIINMGEQRWLKNMAFFDDQLGGVNVTAVQASPDTNVINMTLHSKKGDYWMSFQTRVLPSEPGKLDGQGLRMLENPTVMAQYRWPGKVADEGAIIKEIDRQAAHHNDKNDFSGVVLIAKNDKIIFNKAYGLADQTFKAPNDTATRFNLGSMNKMFTAIAIGQLIQAGKLSFDEPLAEALPDYPNKAVAAKITIRQLLSHTSGLGDFFKDEFFTHREKYVSLKSYLPLFQNDSLQFKPGARFSYSNAGFIVLGVVIEKVSGEDYFDYIKHHIYQPVGMLRSGSFKRDSVVTDLATGYTWPDGSNPLHLKPRIMNWQTLPVQGSSAGGGYATASDLLRFSIAVKNHTLLNATLTDSLLTGHVQLGDREGMNSVYGYGFIDVSINGKRTAGHGGGAPGINGDLKFFRDNSYTVVVLGNYDPPSASSLSDQISAFLAQQ